MDAPPVRFVKTASGVKIAYGVNGSGLPLVLVPVAFSHVQLNWRHEYFVPTRRQTLELLASRFRLVTFDNRGQGMSTRGSQAASLDDNAAVTDLQELVDQLKLEDFLLVGTAYGGHVAVHYALAHPKRVRALILVNTPISMLAFSAGLFESLPVENWEYFLRSLLEPGLALEDVEHGKRMLQEITTQEEWKVAWRTIGHSDIGSFLPRLEVPTLVIASREHSFLHAKESIELAGQIPNARLTIIDGGRPFGEPTQLLQEIERFLEDLAASEETAPSIAAGVKPDGLSSREVEVLRLLATGKSNQQIAQELVISVSTVAKHLNSIFAKAGFTNRTEAAAYAYRNRLV